MLWTASFKVVTSWSEAPDFIIPNKIYRNLALRQLSAIKKKKKCLNAFQSLGQASLRLHLILLSGDRCAVVGHSFRRASYCMTAVCRVY